MVSRSLSRLKSGIPRIPRRAIQLILRKVLKTTFHKEISKT